ncbi:MAG TPA: TIGR00730 family Rossman fold protein [Oscillatoriales bacterium UBA8482]|nr:TIGR00730 family Rossman fold protein [Oscillatoriales bacterium UBA8482]
MSEFVEGYQFLSRMEKEVTILGSARFKDGQEDYKIARGLGQLLGKNGFTTITGGGPGIMEGANRGAYEVGGKSVGLNIQLPFEQSSNPYIQGNKKAIMFKYFFTRKLFFLRESDALAMFPGGFGTLDETFECLTLIQTGKFGPAPLILVDRPGGDYWYDLNKFIHKQLLNRGLISPDDPSFYTITDDLSVACEAIASFYRVYHSSRYVKDQYVMRLKSELSEQQVEQLNTEFHDLLSKGRIEKTQTLPEEMGDDTQELPRLIFHFNQRRVGRLYQMIYRINSMGATSPEAAHPEQK